MDKASDDRGYLLGHTAEELARLERQAAMFADATESVLRRAGIGEGLHVLDIGCGVGDVSLIASRLVGPSGTVTGIDQAEMAVATARARAVAAGHGGLRFERRGIDEIEAGSIHDAIVGRFILMHLPDRVAVLRKLVSHLKPGGVMAFIELDVGSAVAMPPLDLFTRSMNWIVGVYQKVGVETQMGSKLYGTFRAAGLTPELSANVKIEAGPTASAYEFVADTIRSLLPGMERAGVAAAADIGVDTLADRLRVAALAGDNCFIFPRLIGAWARVPR